MMILVFIGITLAFFVAKAPSSRINDAESTIVITALVSLICALAVDISPSNGKDED